jgi:hypothetical protein
MAESHAPSLFRAEGEFLAQVEFMPTASFCES